MRARPEKLANSSHDIKCVASTIHPETRCGWVRTCCVLRIKTTTRRNLLAGCASLVLFFFFSLRPPKIGWDETEAMTRCSNCSALGLQCREQEDGVTRDLTCFLQRRLPPLALPRYEATGCCSDCCTTCTRLFERDDGLAKR